MDRDADEVWTHYLAHCLHVHFLSQKKNQPKNTGATSKSIHTNRIQLQKLYPGQNHLILRLQCQNTTEIGLLDVQMDKQSQKRHIVSNIGEVMKNNPIILDWAKINPWVWCVIWHQNTAQQLVIILDYYNTLRYEVIGERSALLADTSLWCKKLSRFTLSLDVPLCCSPVNQIKSL